MTMTTTESVGILGRDAAFLATLLSFLFYSLPREPLRCCCCPSLSLPPTPSYLVILNYILLAVHINYILFRYLLYLPMYPYIHLLSS